MKKIVSVIIPVLLVFITSCSYVNSDLEQKKKIADLSAKVYNLESEVKKLHQENKEYLEANSNLRDKIESRYTSFYNTIRNENFLFFNNSTSFPLGITRFKGYYNRVKIVDSNNDIEKECNFFVVIEMESQLEQYFTDLIESGNGFNKIIDGRIAVSLDLQNINEEILAAIINSNSNNTISILGFLNETILGGNMKICNDYLQPIVVLR